MFPIYHLIPCPLDPQFPSISFSSAEETEVAVFNTQPKPAIVLAGTISSLV
jgi:hypothetical protein